MFAPIYTHLRIFKINVILFLQQSGCKIFETVRGVFQVEERTVSFSQSLLFFWVKGNVSVDGRAIKIHLRNCILGVIPAGANNQTIPLHNISAADISTSFKIKPFLIGLFWILCTLSSLASMADDFFSGLVVFLIFALLAASSIGNGIVTILTIQRAGKNFCISVPFYEKQKILRLKDMIDEALLQHQDDINVQAAATAQTAALVDAIGKIGK